MTYPGATTYPGSALFPAASSSGRVQVQTDPANTPPRVLLSAAGFTGDTATVFRVDQSGNSTPVRTLNPTQLNGGACIGYDYEAPHNEPVFYRVVTDSGDVDISNTVTLVVTVPWLIHPGIPSLSRPVRIVKRGDRTSDLNEGVFRPLGRELAVVITDGVRQSPTFQLTLGTQSLQEDADLTDLLADGSPLLLQINYTTTQRKYYGWISAGTLVEGDLQEWFGSTVLTWQMDCTVTSAPSGMLQAQRTWADVLAEFPTWQSLLDTYATWRDVITDTRKA